MRSFPIILPALLPLSVLPVVCNAQTVAEREKMNVLFIIVDDLRPVLGCYGDDYIKTPNIDRLASEGTVFTNAYCNVPVSGASRASLLTGLYPRYPDRFIRVDSWAEQEASEAQPMSQWFGSNGYVTISNGKVFHNPTDCVKTWSEEVWMRDLNNSGPDWAEYNKYELWLNDSSAEHINPRTLRGPFCESADKPDSLYEDCATAMRSVEDMKRLHREGKPFFIVNGFRRPHLPFNAPKRYWDLYERDQIPLADNRFLPYDLPSQVTGSKEITQYALVGDTDSDSFHRLARHGYFASVSFVDAQVGLLLDALDELSIRSNTIVVLIGDHGWHLGEHTFWGKHNLMQTATCAPMLISVPNMPAGNVSSSIVEFVDIYPTLCELTHTGEPANQLQGKSMSEVLRNPKAKIKQCARVVWQAGTNVVDEHYSYSCWGTEDAPQAEMLYDRKRDPQQNRNIAAQNPRVTKRYRHLCDKINEQINAD